MRQEISNCCGHDGTFPLMITYLYRNTPNVVVKSHIFFFEGFYNFSWCWTKHLALKSFCFRKKMIIIKKSDQSGKVTLGENPAKFYSLRLRADVQTLTLLYTILTEKVPRSCTFHAPSLRNTSNISGGASPYRKATATFYLDWLNMSYMLR